MGGHKVRNLLNEPRVVCCYGCSRPIAVHYEPLDCIMWCFDCAIDVEIIARHVGIRIADYIVEKLVQARHNNLWKTCGYVYNIWQPQNDVTSQHSNEGATWTTDFTVAHFIAELETK